MSDLSPLTIAAFKQYQSAREDFESHKEFCQSLDPDGDWPRLVDPKYYGEMVARRNDWAYLMGLERSDPDELARMEQRETQDSLREELR